MIKNDIEADAEWAKLSDEQKVKMAGQFAGQLAVAESFRYLKTFESFNR